MHPELFRIPGTEFAISTFGVMLAVAFLVGAWITGPQIAVDVVRAFLAAEFSTEPQFRRRVDKLALLEAEQRLRPPSGS